MFVQTILSSQLIRNYAVNEHALEMSHSFSNKMVHVLTALLVRLFPLIEGHVPNDHVSKVKCALTTVHVDTARPTRDTKVIANAEQTTATSEQLSRRMEPASCAHYTPSQIQTKEETVSATVAGAMLF